jgi:hypothetical protein
MGISGGPYITRDSSLVLELDAADKNSYSGSGTVWRDLTANNYSGSLTNGPTFSSANGGSIVFDGTNDRVDISHSSLYNFITGITISSWYKTTVGVDSYITTKTNDSFYLGIGPTGIIANKMSLFLNGTSGGWLQTTANANTGNWTHVSSTWTGGISYIYLNGVLDISGSRPGTLQTGSNTLHLAYRPDASKYLNGSISNFQLYNRALSAQEIAQNYNEQKSRFGL